MKRFWLVLLFLCVNMQAHAQSETKYWYAVFSAEQQTVTLKAVDPNNPTSVEDRMTLSVPEMMYVSGVSLSPHTEWLVIILRQNGRPEVSFVRLVNLLTSETRDLEQVSVAFFDIADNFAPKRDVIWSPDSRYLSFLSVDADSSLVVPMIYDLQTRQFIPLSNMTTSLTRISWSSDSSKIAFLTENCLYSVCNYSVDIFRVSDRVQQHTITLPWQGSDQGGTAICRMDWSPDDTHISFMRGCEPSSIEGTRELYVVDLTQNTVAQITSFTSNLTPGPSNINVRAAYFDTMWVDTQTLLGGTVYRRDGTDSEVNAQTFLYSLASNQITILNSQMARYWTINPVSNEIAYEAGDFQTLSRTPESATIQIATFSGGELTTITSYFVAGCNLSWSSDGSFLAYVENCNGSIGFISRATGLVQIHTLIYGTDIAYGTMLTYLGWVD